MDPILLGGLAVVALLVLLFAGVYVAVALACVGIAGLLIIAGFQPTMSTIAGLGFHFGSQYGFIVFPLFVAMGLLAAEGGISKDLYDGLTKWVGMAKGGLGLATIGGCTIFGTLTGSSIVTAVVFAKVGVPEMRRHGYDPRISYGLVCSAGAIGLLIPPNLLAVVYALLTEQSLGQLLMAGIGPGIVLAFCLGLGLVVLLYLRPSLGPPVSEIRTTWRDRFIAIPKLWPAFVVGGVVIGGVYAGLFTVIESAGIGTFMLLFVYFLLKGINGTSLKAVARSLRESVALSAMVLIILVTAQIFGRLLVLSKLGDHLVGYVTASQFSPMQFVLIAVVLYLILGMLIDSISILAITVPLFYPIVLQLKIDPVWFATVMILATQLGIVTPPFAMAVFAVKAVADPDVTLEGIFRGAMPFLIFMAVALIIVIAIPAISTWIPYHMWQP